MDGVKILTEGDSSLLIEFGKEISPEINGKITALVHLLKAQQIEGVVDLIPAFCSLLINYDPRVITYSKLKKRLEKLLKLEVEAKQSVKKVIEIPVCYGGEYGPDLDNIAEHAGLNREEVIKIHSSRDYLIYMLGFLPGFSYLGGLDERIHTPRLANPRIKISAGSVGIGGSQTGIYPLDSPGGWQLLGMTPVKTYDPNRNQPILFEAGDYIRFVPVSEEEYLNIKDQVDAGTYECAIRSMEV
ncbi:Sporulation inhibitor kipI [uncultured Roseburia sp.]|uniref:5-oxoprolinase subunit PxpB n=1 Tax=Brotonthovivens ammoniilytica TaxID=2981725 RepID=A0ABT2TFZ1_9FIRM|nr:5-oxoprolinase subunit PxpB [Brotonthovivens ammoniilytica]MCU6761109.1 5-oxoprolinase subunit PxpB [Brotonthovivens ammoniilytica]SCI19144.1 Sporulation inhibitor kipI [uncultured Roseburia sp.]